MVDHGSEDHFILVNESTGKGETITLSRTIYAIMKNFGMNSIGSTLKGNCKNSVGLKPNAELRKDAKAPSIPKS
ncbi:MAG: hypothetical protein OMM_11363 [Candidatus Magnetoglobus multicellularis str. Araruama]|uniref:Uncharacterized protein n=1 Tax=Candidatus Magnetoglobus multicellularis str. Araruama TaxID=890399 RepID=A0A1V1NYI9_9BACT|nr:MAG: hypothetical protein OMM_11363 [Candidatus Magnetoglobus multicellularis str. Araruama]